MGPRGGSSLSLESCRVLREEEIKEPDGGARSSRSSSDIYVCSKWEVESNEGESVD